MRHRGPDGSGVWQSKDGRVSLSHTRLSTIDLLSGAQPILNEDGTIIAVVNGEFYGFEAIRKELEGFGHRFRSRTDSEILVHLYERHGTSCLNQLHGEFAFVVWDEREQILFAARDRFGTKPLYFSESKGEVLFSSEVKGLEQAGVILSWDEQGFFEKFVFQTSLNGRTLFRGVCELPAGYYFLLKNGSSVVRPYWDICYPFEEDLAPLESDDSYANTLRELLDRAVQSRMRADVPVACYLSGGIDSNGILGLMTRHSTRPVQAFCLSFDDPALDEFDLAARSAAHLGADLAKVSVTDKSLASDFAQTIWHCENLIENANSVAKFALSRAVNAAGYRVVLVGEGSDEIFAGYPIFMVDSLRHGSAAEFEELKGRLGLTTEGLRQLMYPEGRTEPATLISRLGYYPDWLAGRHRILTEFASIFPDAIGKSDIDARLLDSLEVRTQLNGRSVLNQSLYIHAKTSLPGVTLSLLGDRVEMAHSVESRLPFLDDRVFDFARNLPRSQKIRQGAEKFVLRMAMRSIVSPEICGRRKSPLLAPPALSNGSSALGQLVQDLLRSRFLESIPFLEKRATRQFLDRLISMDTISRELDGPLMTLASACVLAEKFSL
jgi:asparagine synthase (glutamine-hydrolysing)